MVAAEKEEMSRFKKMQVYRHENKDARQIRRSDVDWLLKKWLVKSESLSYFAGAPCLSS